MAAIFTFSPSSIDRLTTGGRPSMSRRSELAETRRLNLPVKGVGADGTARRLPMLKHRAAARMT
jgi:hypothetical protein